MSEMLLKPDLSVVVTARNDDYGVGFIDRFDLFQRMLLSQAQNIGLRLELIVVEWNPLPGKPRLAEAVKWFKGSGASTVRILEVPKSLHDSFPNAKGTPVLEYQGKNAGLRRASSDFVLVSNPDIVLSDELLAFVASGSLEDGFIYRVDRQDVFRSMPSILACEQDTANCLRALSSSVVYVHTGDDSYPVSPWKRLVLRGLGISPRTFFFKGFKDLLLSPGKILRERKRRNVIMDVPPGYVHHSMSGDFMLASKRLWNLIAGFPEKLDLSTNLDSIACYQFSFSGYRQKLFLPPCRIFHVDHSRKDAEGRSRPSDPEKIYQAIRDGQMRGPFNDSDDWGLAKHQLKETVI